MSKNFEVRGTWDFWFLVDFFLKIMVKCSFAYSESEMYMHIGPENLFCLCAGAF